MVAGTGLLQGGGRSIGAQRAPDAAVGVRAVQIDAEPLAEPIIRGKVDVPAVLTAARTDMNRGAGAEIRERTRELGKGVRANVRVQLYGCTRAHEYTHGARALRTLAAPYTKTRTAWTLTNAFSRA